MKTYWRYLVLVPVLISCSTEKRTAEPMSFPSRLEHISPQQDIVFNCLETHGAFLKQKPTTLKKFAKKVGEASVVCNASDDDVARYAFAVHEKFGQ